MNEPDAYLGITFSGIKAEAGTGVLNVNRDKHLQAAALYGKWSNELRELVKQAPVWSRFLIVPLFFFLLPPRLSLCIVIFAVVAYAVLAPVVKKFSPVLFELVERAFNRGAERSFAFKSFTSFISAMKPFILWALFLACPIAMMVAHSANKCLVALEKNGDGGDLAPDALALPDKCLRLPQNLSHEPHGHEENFLNSPAFTVTAAALFLSGAPALVTFACYCFLGVDRVLGFPSANPQFLKIFFGIMLYTYSIGWCLSTLFFKAYFTYPLSFTSMERDVIVDHVGVRTSHIKGWFLQASLFTDPDCWPCEIEWKNVRSIEYSQDGVGYMSPLPGSQLTKSTAIYKLLNKFAAFTDAVVKRRKPATYLHILEQPSSDRGMVRGVKINLWELDEAQRWQLYDALRHWSPTALFSENALSNLIGRNAHEACKFPEPAIDYVNDCALLGLDDQRMPEFINALETKTGRSLRALVNSEHGPFSVSELLPLAIQMCAILKYLHNMPAPIVHRAFTPDNLVVDESGRLQLVDFSFARRAGDGDTAECAGKRSYMPPEQLRGELNVQSDIYAFGATLYFLWTGEDPSPLTALSSCASGSRVEAGFDAIICKATSLELCDRYDCVEWLEVDLNSLIVGRTGLLPPNNGS